MLFLRNYVYQRKTADSHVNNSLATCEITVLVYLGQSIYICKNHNLPILTQVSNSSSDDMVSNVTFFNIMFHFGVKFWFFLEYSDIMLGVGMGDVGAKYPW